VKAGEIAIPMTPRELQTWRESGITLASHLKLKYMKRVALESEEDYLVWLDSDCELYGRPDLARFANRDRTVFACLEGDIFSAKKNWWWTLDQWRKVLARMNHPRPEFYNLNGGFFGVHRKRILELEDFYNSIPDRDLGIPKTMDEAYLSYAIQAMEKDLDLLMIERNLDVFMYTFEFPKPTQFVNWCTGKKTPLPPKTGIIHFIGGHNKITKTG